MKNLIGYSFSWLCAGLLTFSSRAQDSTNAADTLRQYVADFQKSPDDQELRNIKEKIIKLAATMNPKPEIPDDANRHFVKAATFMKEAKDKSDYQLAVDEYQQALLLAPWWGAAYYNEGVALQSAGKYDLATKDLKLYLLTDPAEKDAAEAKNRIYSIEAEKELATKHAADEAAKAQVEAAKRAKAQDLAGDWRRESGSTFITIRKSGGSYVGSIPNNGVWIKCPRQRQFTSESISGRPRKLLDIRTNSAFRLCNLDQG